MKTNLRTIILLMITTLLLGSCTQESEPSRVDKYNVSWTEKSTIASDAMPLGNGTTGALVSVTEDGHIWLSLRHIDAWSEAHRLLKLGDLELSISPNPFEQSFKQDLILSEGAIYLSGDNGFSSKIWIDANNELIHLENESNREFEITAKLHSWRTKPKIIRETNLNGIPGGIEESADIILNAEDALMWYHRNESDKAFRWAIKALEIPMPDGLHNVLGKRTFGAKVSGDKMSSVSSTELRSELSKKSHIQIHTLNSQPEKVETWIDELNRNSTQNRNLKTDWENHVFWWNTFWNKSYIHISGTPDADSTSAGYAYTMYLNAMAGKGEFPIIWNGSMFAPAMSEVPQRNHTGFRYNDDPDFRSWGNLMLHQNVRLPFYSMNAAGQFDYTSSFIDLYMRGFPLMKEHTKATFGHEGTVTRESTTLWGVIAPGVYGINREGLKPGQQASVWHQTHWNAALEVSWYLAEHYEYTQNETFARDTLIPFASEAIKFFDVHWPHRGGKLYFPDVHCLESFRKVDNPMPFITGLMCVIERLLALPKDLTTETDRKYWKEVYERIPEIPTWEYKGQTILANAEVMKSPKVNVEVSELYSVFPFHIFGIGKPELELAQRTYRNRSTLITEGAFKNPGWAKGHLRGGWHPESIMAAMVGLTDSVKMEVIWALNRPVPEQRFPGFFKSTHDGVPDVQHSSVAATALQRMLLQDVDEKIVLVPAWPNDWSCDFKLYAKQNTIVEGKVEAGKLVKLKVTPENRKNDVYVGADLTRPAERIWY